MNILTKYLEGTIFANFYMMNLASMCGVICSSSVYALGLRNSFLFTSIWLFLSCLMLLCFESGLLDPEFIYWIGLSRASPYTIDEEMSEKFYMKRVVPYLSFLILFFA